MRRKLEFDPYQTAVIAFRRGRAVAMACPGSGKTSVTVERVRQLLAEGIPENHILCSTFTKEGAHEMTERAGIDSEHKLFTTFHSWALAFVKAEASLFAFKIRTDWHGNPNPLALPVEAARYLGLAVRNCNQTYRPNFKIEFKDAGSAISLYKRRGIGPNKAMLEAKTEREEMMAHIYQHYDSALQKHGVMDFDSLIVETARLLIMRPDVRARWQYEYIMVDEAQDTDSVQWRIVSLVSEKHGNVLAVGDENQAMYGWRGSESNLTEYFKSIYPDAAVLPLPRNYRSTGAIVEYCRNIAPVKNEAVEKFHTLKERGIEPEFKLYKVEDEEAKGTLNSITDFENSAILARTNGQLAIFESECSNRELRYKTLGKSGYWATNEVKDVVAMVGSVVFPTDGAIVRMLTSHCEVTKFLRKHDVFKDGQKVKGCVTLLKEFQEGLPNASETGRPVLLHKLLTRYSSGDAQDEQLRYIGHMLQELRGRVKEMEAGAAMELVLDRFRVREFYDADTDKEAGFDNDPLENIDKLVLYAKKRPTLADFYDYTQKLYRAKRARSGFITLSTIHQAKGKEWANVFVVGVNMDVLPHIKGDPLEELKIYHVACSRAKTRLTVSASGVPSDLIKDLVKETVDLYSGFQLSSGIPQ